MASKVCGTITRVVKGHIHANVQIMWKSIPLSVVITKASCEDMHLSEGDSITVLIKGTDVMLAKSFSGMISARNRVSGIVKRYYRGRRCIQGVCGIAGRDASCNYHQYLIERDGY